MRNGGCSRKIKFSFFSQKIEELFSEFQFFSRISWKDLNFVLFIVVIKSNFDGQKNRQDED